MYANKITNTRGILLGRHGNYFYIPSFGCQIEPLDYIAITFIKMFEAGYCTHFVNIDLIFIFLHRIRTKPKRIVSWIESVPRRLRLLVFDGFCFGNSTQMAR